jgi:hypothetical protein
LVFQYFNFERTWWRLFQKRVVHTKLDIYVFIIIGSVVYFNFIMVGNVNIKHLYFFYQETSIFFKRILTELKIEQSFFPFILGIWLHNNICMWNKQHNFASLFLLVLVFFFGLWCLTLLSTIFQLYYESVLLAEETGVPGENHWPVVRHWQTLSYNVESSIPRHERGLISHLTRHLMCNTGSSKLNYHSITTMTAPFFLIWTTVNDHNVNTTMIYE